jgi:CO/xanthine dehydrogenase Mo-binding subunit
VIPVAAAVANAVKDAVGVRLTELPMTPERVFRALAARPA